MSERLQDSLDRIGRADLSAVATGAIGAEATLVGAHQAERIVAANGDPSTLAVMRYSGRACVNNVEQTWSAVAKVIDTAVPQRLHWVRSSDEIALYRSRHFAGGAGGFRPARCYHISQPSAGITVLWLEDLTGVRRTPFSLDELAQIVRHVGRWNAEQARRPLPAIDFKDYTVFARWEKAEWDLEREFAAFRAMDREPEVQALYRGRPLDVAFALRDGFLANNRRARGLPRSVCFGDANVGNIFATRDETIAIDWSSLTLDPIGVDAGSVVGSATTFGGEFIAIAANERELFGHYVEGLTEGGWRGQRDDVRRAFLVHYGGYLISNAILPAFIGKFPRDRIERRLGMPWDEMFHRHAGIIDLLPGYVEELSRLNG